MQKLMSIMMKLFLTYYYFLLLDYFLLLKNRSPFTFCDKYYALLELNNQIFLSVLRILASS